MNRKTIAGAVAAAALTAVGGGVAISKASSDPAPFGYCTTQPMDGQGWCRRMHQDGHTSPFPETLVIRVDAGVGHCADPFPCEIPADEYDSNLKRP